MYCQTPKVGSTNFLNIFGKLDDIIDESWGAQIHNVKLPQLSFLGKDEQQKVLQEYTKFMVIREPLERLFSTYRDKIMPFESRFPPLFVNLTKDILFFYRSEESDFNEKYPSLEEFTTFVTDNSKKKAKKIKVHYSEKRHWQPQVDICYPCNIDYDYVLSMDDVNLEADYLFRKVDIPASIKYPKHRSNAVTHDLYSLRRNYFAREYFANISSSLLKAILRYYDKDYKIFEYKPHFEF